MSDIKATITKEIGKRIKTLRAMRGFTQQELGKKCGISFQQVQKYEKGHNSIYVHRLADIATVLGVSINYFFSPNKIMETYKDAEPKWQMQEAQQPFYNDTMHDNQNNELKQLMSKAMLLENNHEKAVVIEVLKVLLNTNNCSTVPDFNVI